MCSAHSISFHHIFLRCLQRWWGLLALACSLYAVGLLAHAQTPVENSSDASAPITTPDGQGRVRTLSVPHFPVGEAIRDADEDWVAANIAVGRFPRGHADIVNWEKAQASKAGPSPISVRRETPGRTHPHGERP